MNCINLQCASICDAPNWPLHGAYQRDALNNWKSLKYKWTPNLINLQHRIPTVLNSCSCCFLASTLFFVLAVSAPPPVKPSSTSAPRVTPTSHPTLLFKTKKVWQSSQGQSLHSGRTCWSHAQGGRLIFEVLRHHLQEFHLPTFWILWLSFGRFSSNVGASFDLENVCEIEPMLM